MEKLFSEGKLDPDVFPSLLPASGWSQSAVRVVVFDYDLTLTLETRNSAIDDYVSGWRGQIDPWRVLDTSPGAGWDSYGGKFNADGMTAEELREEFNSGKHTSQALMQQSMQNFIRISFNDGAREATAEKRAEFLAEEVHNPEKRVYELKCLLQLIRNGLDEQTPRGKLVIMTYNAWGSIFVLNTLIHAELSEYFDVIHSSLNTVRRIDGHWRVFDESEITIQGRDVSNIQIATGGTIPTGPGGKAEAIEKYYSEFGGLRHALLIDDEQQNVDAWIDKGGAFVVDLSKAPSAHKLTVPYIRQAYRYFSLNAAYSSTAETLTPLPDDISPTTDYTASPTSVDENYQDEN